MSQSWARFKQKVTQWVGLFVCQSVCLSVSYENVIEETNVLISSSELEASWLLLLLSRSLFFFSYSMFFSKNAFHFCFRVLLAGSLADWSTCNERISDFPRRLIRVPKTRVYLVEVAEAFHAAESAAFTAFVMFQVLTSSKNKLRRAVSRKRKHDSDFCKRHVFLSLGHYISANRMSSSSSSWPNISQFQLSPYDKKKRQFWYLRLWNGQIFGRAGPSFTLFVT